MIKEDRSGWIKKISDFGIVTPTNHHSSGGSEVIRIQPDYKMDIMGYELNGGLIEYIYIYSSKPPTRWMYELPNGTDQTDQWLQLCLLGALLENALVRDFL